VRGVSIDFSLQARDNLQCHIYRTRADADIWSSKAVEYALRRVVRHPEIGDEDDTSGWLVIAALLSFIPRSAIRPLRLPTIRLRRQKSDYLSFANTSQN